MSIKKLHNNEVDINIAIVQNLVASQFPQFSKLNIKPVTGSGTDNVMFRLGNDMSIRLPRKSEAEQAIIKECTWLPKLALHLPLAIPKPLAQGKASENYPFTWSICRWHEGQNASLDQITCPHQMAADLAGFITALRRIDTKGGPLPTHPLNRGVPLAVRSEETATAVWEDALKLPAWQNPPVWIHGDLHYGNLLACKGKLTTIIDFGAMRIGDPACDLMTAWNLFDDGIRKTYRQALNVDEATWFRGRAWALSVAVHALSYYKDTNPFFANLSRYTINEVISDYNIST